MSIVSYKTADTVPSDGPSPIIWADCPVISMQKDPGKGIHIFEDFIGKIKDLAAAGQFGLFEMVDDGGDGLCVQDTAAYDGEKGVACLEPDGQTAYDEAYLVSPVLTQIKMGNAKKIWLETRVKLSDYDADISVIFGLGDATMLEGTSVIEESATPDFIESRDFVGFVAFTDGSNLGDIDTIYCEVGDAAVTQVKDSAGAFSADDTYIKLGLKYDGVQYVTFYIDGVELVDKLDVDDFATVTANQLTAQGVILGLMDAAGAHAGGCAHLDIDWIRFACER